MDLITVNIPEEKALTMLSNAIAEIRSLTGTLDFNVDHRQFDLMEKHLVSITRAARIAEELRRAMHEKRTPTSTP